ncbi:MAG TPA: AAA family ATPase [Ktedonobacterales bacterium]
MRRILLTGMAGVGKSTVTGELAARGYHAVDADTEEYSEWAPIAGAGDAGPSPARPGMDWVWREDRVQALLAAEVAGTLFVSGCAENMRRFLPQFDRVILLSAPPEVMAVRLRERTTNAYGKDPAEAARALELAESVEPLLRRIATDEIDTRAPLDEVVARVLRVALTPWPPPH